MKPNPRTKRATASRHGMKLVLVSLGEEVERITTRQAFDRAWLRFTDEIPVPDEFERQWAAVFKAGYSAGVGDVVHLMKTLADVVKETEAGA